MADRLLSQACPGSIVLLHDSIFHKPDISDATTPLLDRTAMLSALENFLEKTKQKYRFVTLPEMLRLGRPVRSM
jgi:hypothetical protein